MIIDRFEGSYCIIEAKDEMLCIPIEKVEKGAKAGDVVNYIDGKYVVDTEETLARQERINNMFQRLKYRRHRS